MGFFKFFSQFSNPVPDENGCIDTPVEYFPDTSPLEEDSVTPIENEPLSIGTNLFGSDSMFDSSDSDFGDSFNSISCSLESDPFGTDW